MVETIIQFTLYLLSSAVGRKRHQATADGLSRGCGVYSRCLHAAATAERADALPS
jgi:hypothetical protein